MYEYVRRGRAARALDRISFSPGERGFSIYFATFCQLLFVFRLPLFYLFLIISILDGFCVYL